jgi:hypothetical protein
MSKRRHLWIHTIWLAANCKTGEPQRPLIPQSGDEKLVGMRLPGRTHKPIGRMPKPSLSNEVFSINTWFVVSSLEFCLMKNFAVHSIRRPGARECFVKSFDCQPGSEFLGSIRVEDWLVIYKIGPPDVWAAFVVREGK